MKDILQLLSRITYRPYRLSYVAALFIGCLLLQLSCGGSGSDQLAGQLKGLYLFDEPNIELKSGQLTVYRLKTLGQKEQLQTVEVFGKLSEVRLSGLAGDLLFVLINARYVDRVSGLAANFSEETSWESVVLNYNGEDKGVHVNVFTSMIVSYARYLEKTQGLAAAEAVARATEEVEAFYGLDDLVSTPAAPLEGKTPPLGSEERYSMLLFGMSQLARQTGGVSLAALGRVLAEDVSDGSLDGNLGATRLAAGTRLIYRDQFSVRLAEALRTVAADSGLHNGSFSADDLQDLISHLRRPRWGSSILVVIPEAMTVSVRNSISPGPTPISFSTV